MPKPLSLHSALIVEDEYLLAADLQLLLETFGICCIAMVPTCEEALKRLEDRSFDVVTVDVKLGDGTCERLVEVLQRRAIPFVYISGFERGILQGLPKAPWVDKPASADAVLVALQSVLAVDS